MKMIKQFSLVFDIVIKNNKKIVQMMNCINLTQLEIEECHAPTPSWQLKNISPTFKSVP
jgi:FtsZ-binding cell division protein ZapB